MARVLPPRAPTPRGSPRHGAGRTPARPPRRNPCDFLFLSPVCFLNCSNHKREVAERCTGKGSGEEQRRIATGGCGHPVPTPEPPAAPSPRPRARCGRESGAGSEPPEGLGPPSADRSLFSLPFSLSLSPPLSLSFFSVCLQPLEGSCDESSLDRFQEQLKRSPLWGWEWEVSRARSAPECKMVQRTAGTAEGTAPRPQSCWHGAMRRGRGAGPGSAPSIP